MDKQQTTNNIKIPNKNLEKLKRDFPQCFDKNGNFDFEKFKKELLKNEIDFSKESYGMDWLGKSYARLLASDEATTLLKENEKWNKKDENKNSQNLLIKGDNLEVLKHLSNAYYEKIKMIYIDPPYNTGSDGFVYQDDRKFTVEELSKLAVIDEEKAKRILDFVNSKSNSHSAWLTFMYPRLYIARQLLREDGVIFVSIDDNEVVQLRILMDEIFGEENFINKFVWINNPAGRQIQGIGATTTKEYILCYSKSFDNLEEFYINIEIAKKYLPSMYKGFNFEIKEDKKGKYIITHELNNGNSKYNEKTRPNLVFNIFYNPKTGEVKTGEIDEPAPQNFIKICPKKITGSINAKYYAWRWNKEKVVKDFEDLEFIKINNKWKVFTKRRDFNRTIFKDVITDITTTRGSQDLKNYDLEKYFNYPKSVILIKIFATLITQNTDLILDFFAGSGTTGDAVMQLNAEDGGNRKYILVQLPEPIDEKKNKTAYDFVKNELKVENPTIFEITKERLIRASKKIKEETINKKIKEKKEEIKKLKQQLQTDETKEKIKLLEKEIENLKNQDLGFKIFETTPIWEDYNFKAEKFDPQQKLFDESKLTDEDIKTLLITWKTYDGIPLTEDLKEIDLNGYKGYYFGTKLYLMHKGFETKNLKKLLEEIDENQDFNPATIIAFGYNFESKILREIAENVKNYANKKQIDIDFIIRY